MQNKAPKRTTRPKRRGCLPRWMMGTMALVAAIVFGWMLLEANVVRLVREEVVLRDLPEAFDGVTILFVSDIHLDFYNAPERASALLHRLAENKPDMIVLGGDYSTYGLDLILRGKLGRGTHRSRRRIETARRDRFFELIADVDAPLGRYAVAGNHDNALAGLENAMASSGFTLLRNKAVRIERNGQTLCVAGVDDWSTGDTAGYKKLAQSISSTECAMLISHNPDALPRVCSLEASDGGRWVDLMLSGHTHGGQIRPFGRQIFASTVYGDRYLSGWIEEGGVQLLTSNGAGSLYLPLRLGAPAQAHIIALRRAEPSG